MIAFSKNLYLRMKDKSNKTYSYQKDRAKMFKEENSEYIECKSVSVLVKTSRSIEKHENILAGLQLTLPSY